MARCLLCSSTVDDAAAVCPHCGGAVAPDEASSPWDDPTRIDGAPGTTGASGSFGATGPFGATPSAVGPYGAVPPEGPPSWGPPVAPPGPGVDPYLGSSAPPAAWAPAPAYGTPGYGAPACGAPAYGAPEYGAPGYGAPGYGASPGFGAYPGYRPYGAGYPGYVPPVPTDNLAVASLIVVVAGLALAFACYLPVVACPVGAVMGHVALSRIKDTGHGGRGLALAAIIIGWAVTLLGALLVALVVGIAVA